MKANLNSSEIENILTAPFKSQTSELVQLRDKAMLEVLFASGLKTAELAHLTKADINFEEQKVNLKNNRILELSHQACFHLKNYLNKRKDGLQVLFVRHDRAAGNKTSGPLTSRSIQRTFEYYRKLAGVKNKITPATLRHYFALKLIRAGATLATVQATLGHKYRATTNLYLKIQQAT